MQQHAERESDLVDNLELHALVQWRRGPNGLSDAMLETFLLALK